MVGDSELSDGQVVERVLDGDRDAFGILVRRYQDGLFRHAVRMTNRPDEAADIVQMAFVKGFQNLHRCRNPARVGGWLFRINANQCKDYLKNRRRQNVSLDDAAPMASEEGDPEEAAEADDLGERIAGALGRLSEDEREAFVMKHVEGYSYEEMSELLDASVSALKMRVYRARESLQTLLEEYR